MTRQAEIIRDKRRHFAAPGGFHDKLVGGMKLRGYPADFAERTFQQIKGFGSYGFPESHAASFALIAYASAWVKCHHPALFCAALLNSQPMGFYAPAQVVRDAREHDIEVRPIDVNRSGTRKEDLLLHPDELAQVAILRRVLADMHPVEAMELLVNRAKKSKSNAEFLLQMNM